MTYRNDVTDHFSSFFLANQVVPQTIHRGASVARARSTMIVNLSAQYLQRFAPMQRPADREDAGSRSPSGSSALRSITRRVRVGPSTTTARTMRSPALVATGPIRPSTVP